MITLLGSLLGFGTSIVPEILGFFKQGQVETEKLYEHDMALASHGGWVVSLQASVRPVITYLFMATFIAVEGGLVYSLIANQNVDWPTALESAFGDEEMAMFSAILSFWFGNRAMSKARAMVTKR